MRALLDRYLRLLKAAASEPELPVGKLQTMLGAKADALGAAKTPARRP
jgi:hypothetical protein